MANINQHQKKIFTNKAHTNVQEFFFTSDNMPFFKLSDAQAQADNLKKLGKSDAIAHVTRSEYETQIAAEKEAGTTDPETVQAQADADAANVEAVAAANQLTQDANDQKTAQDALTAATATGDATAIAAAQANLNNIQLKANADATRSEKAKAAYAAKKAIADALIANEAAKAALSQGK